MVIVGVTAAQTRSIKWKTDSGNADWTEVVHDAVNPLGQR
jgi:hypothetical protein